MRHLVARIDANRDGLHTSSMRSKLSLPMAIGAVLLVQAAAAVDLRQALADGKTSLGFRYRFEHVSQDGIDNDALASTARARLTWNSAETDNFTFGIETDYALILGIEDFNSTTNGQTEYPIVADPEGFDLTQAFVKYQSGDTTVTVGRQRINHGTQRILGGVAYRQNEQTYDALRVQGKAGNIDVDYSYIHNINRIFGPGDAVQPGDWYGNSHAFRASTTPSEATLSPASPTSSTSRTPTARPTPTRPTVLTTKARSTS